MCLSAFVSALDFMRWQARNYLLLSHKSIVFLLESVLGKKPKVKSFFHIVFYLFLKY